MADWLEVSNANLDSNCGSTSAHTCGEALNGTDYWYHAVNEVHWMIIDLGRPYTITKVKGRSNDPNRNPTDVNIFVSNNKEAFGDAVVEGINTWVDVDDGMVEIEVTEKIGRYVKVEIEATEHVSDWLGFGDSYSAYTIFDVYGELAAKPSQFISDQLSGKANWAW